MCLWFMTFGTSHCRRSAYTVFPKTHVISDRFHSGAKWASNHIIKIELMAIWGFHLVSLILTLVSHTILSWMIEYFTEIQGDELQLLQAYQALLTPAHSGTKNNRVWDCKDIHYGLGTNTRVDRNLANLLLVSELVGLKLTQGCACEICCLNCWSLWLVMAQGVSKLE